MNRDETEKVPRAWIVLAPRGHSPGHAASAKEVETCVKERLGGFNWLADVIEFIDEVCVCARVRSFGVLSDSRFEFFVS